MIEKETGDLSFIVYYYWKKVKRFFFIVASYLLVSSSKMENGTKSFCKCSMGGTFKGFYFLKPADLYFSLQLSPTFLFHRSISLHVSITPT